MGEESILKGGLNYELNVGGNFEQVLQQFEKKISELEARAKSLGKTSGLSTSAGKSSGSGKSGSSSTAVTDGRAEEVIKKRLLKLEDQLLLAQQSSIKNQRIITDLAQRLQDVQVKSAVVKGELAKAEVITQRATEKNLTAQQKLLDKTEQIKQARAQGANAKETIAQTTGLSDKDIAKFDKQIAAQDAATKKQKEMTAAQIEQARNANAAYVKDEKDALDTRSKQWGAYFAKQEDQITAQEKLRKKTAKEERVEREANLKEQAKTAELVRKQNELNAQSVALKRQVVQYSREHNVSENAAARAIGLSASQAKKLGFEMNQAQQFAQNFFFTFRRLVGILAIFTLARQFAQFLGQGVTEMSRFNGVLEQTRLSFASIIASVGDISDINGNLATGVEKYNAALRISDGLTKEIRKDALNTVATFEELLGAFQAGIAPGLQAGLDVKQIEKVTVAMVKAASVMGVSGDKFTEEIRSVLTGTGTIRNTRLYQIMDKAEIQRAKDQGKLYEYLTKKLEPFNIASEKVSQSWQGLVSNLKDATQNLLASGGVEYFETLKASMSALINTMVDMDKLKAGFDLKDVLNKAALGAVEEVSSALSDLIKDFGALNSVEDAFQGIRSVLAAVGETIKIIGSAFSVLVSGIGQGISIFSAFLALALKLGQAIVSIIPQPLIDGFKILLTSLIAIVTISTTWSYLLAAIAGISKAISTTIMGISIIQTAVIALTKAWHAYVVLVEGGMSAIQAIMTVIQLSTGLVGIIFATIALVLGVILYKTGAISKLFDKLNGKTDDMKKRWADISKSLHDATVGVGAQSEAVKKLEENYKKVSDRIDELTDKLKADIILSGIKGEARQVFSVFSEGNLELIKNMRDANKEMARIDADIESRRSKRNQKDIDEAKEFMSLVDMKVKAQEKMLVAIADPSDVTIKTKKQKRVDDMVEPSKGVVDVNKKILQDEADLQALEASRVLQAQKLVEIQARLREIISKQVQIAKVEVEAQVDGIDIITRAYDIRRTRLGEIKVLENDILERYIQQSNTAEQIQALMKRQAELRQEAEDKENVLIQQAIELGATQEEINALKEAQNIHQQRYIDMQSRSQAELDNILADQQLLTIELDNQLNTLDAINKRYDLSQALAGELYRHGSNAVRELAQQTVEVARQQALYEKNNTLRKQEEETAQRAVDTAIIQGQSLEIINSLEQDRLVKMRDNVTVANTEAVILSSMKKDLEEMSKLTLSTGLKSIGVGFSQGAQDFIDAAEPMAKQFADAMKDALNNVIEDAASSITDSIDPRKEAKSASDIAADAIFGLAQAMIQTILQQFAIDMLTSMFGFQSASSINTTALGLNTAALGTVATELTALGTGLGINMAATTANTAATGVDAAATTTNAASTAGNTVATTANTGGLFGMLGGLLANTMAIIGNTIAFIANTAMMIGQMIANVAALAFNSLMLIVNAAIPGRTGGQVGSKGFGRKVAGLPGGYYQGGLIEEIFGAMGFAKGYVHGGNVATHPRPSYISPRDTVPAWLQPREYVMPVKRVDEWGVGFFEGIRNGDITPKMLGITPGMGMNLLSSKVKATKGVYGFAEGGAVPRVASTRLSGSGGSSTQILPVVVADNNTVDQMLSGGRKSFNRKVNEASGRDRNASDTWR